MPVLGQTPNIRLIPVLQILSVALPDFSLYYGTYILYKSNIMLTINISDFRSNLLKYLEAANSGEQIFVTSNGKLLASVTAPEDKKAIAKKQLNSLATTAQLHDVITPIESEWDALQ